MNEYHDKAIGILNEFEDNEAKNQSHVVAQIYNK